jgi:crotonobetainyl-CoA:carnitine CoA-transferase CaiB-like acyl-CoA transferase
MKKRTILSLEQALSLSYGTLRFVQAGWRVIRLESTPAPGSKTPGDPNRYVGKLLAEPDRRSYFIAPNVGKECVALNLKEEKGRALLHKIVKELPVDIFCSNTLPKRYHALGIDFETLSELNPNLVWAGISAYGPDYPDHPGYDPALQAKLGYSWLTGDPAGPPTMCGVPIIDLKAGDEFYARVMGALLEQAESGGGAKRIDISMAHSAVSWLLTSLPLVDMGTDPADVTRSGNDHREFVPVNVYPAADGYVYLAVGNDVQWKRLMALDLFAGLRKEEWMVNAGRKKARREIHSMIEKILKTMTVREAVDLLAAGGLVVNEVNDIEGVKSLPAMHDKLCSVEFPEGRTVQLPPTGYLDEGAAQKFQPPPRYGQHTKKVLGEIGCSEIEIGELQRSGIIAGPES